MCIRDSDGAVYISENKKNLKVVTVKNELGEEKEYEIPFGEVLLVRDGMNIKAGEQITKGLSLIHILKTVASCMKE